MTSVYLNPAQFKAELERCLNCPTQPCFKACPTACNPASFIQLAKIGRLRAAANDLRQTNPMAHVCGLLCPERFCMQACTRGRIDFPIHIPAVQAYLMRAAEKEGPSAESSYSESSVPTQGSAVAVIGAGPAGLSAACRLAQNGYPVTLFEQSDRIGGALNMIPAERLPRNALAADWNFIQSAGRITLRLNTPVPDIQKTAADFAGVIVATGLPIGGMLNIPGETDILPYQTYLTNPEIYAGGGNVAVIGGGNVAADCALTALQNGATHVELFVRRGLKHMRMSARERNTLIERGVEITTLTRPTGVVRQADGLLTLETIKTRLTEGELTDIPGTRLNCPDWRVIIKAIGSVKTRFPESATLIEAGDCKSGSSTVVEAVASGKAAADKLIQTLKEKTSSP